MKAHERILVALDTPNPDGAVTLAGTLRGRVGGVKVGLELFSSAGESRAETMGRVAVLVMVSALTEQIVYPEHTPAAAAGVGTAELAEELGRMLAAYAGTLPG